MTSGTVVTLDSAATKKSDELLAHSSAKLYNIPSNGLRFFTVYGSAGRPDMFYYSATKRLVAGGTIQIFNYGNCMRDFTYIDDIVEGVLRVMQGAPEKMAGEDGLPLPPYAVYNIGGGQPENIPSIPFRVDKHGLPILIGDGVDAGIKGAV